MFDVGVLEPERVLSECRLERRRLEEDEVVEERTIMVRISSLRKLIEAGVSRYFDEMITIDLVESTLTIRLQTCKMLRLSNR